MAYRAAVEQKRSIEVVHYRPMNPLSVTLLSLIILAMAAFSLFQAVTHARSTRFECVRGGANTCVVVRDYGLFTTRQALPIHYIHAVRMTSHSGKSGTKYGVSITMRDGASVALMRPASQGYAELVRSGAESLALDERPGASSMPVEDASPLMALFMTTVGVLFGAVTLLFTRTARLEFDLDRGVIRYRRQRWPLSPVRRTFEAGEVTRARVIARPGSKGGTLYETALVLRAGPDFELVPNGGGDERRNEAAAARINALLDKMRDEAALTS
jgi:hypothetical protein